MSASEFVASIRRADRTVVFTEDMAEMGVLLFCDHRCLNPGPILEALRTEHLDGLEYLDGLFRFIKN